MKKILNKLRLKAFMLCLITLGLLACFIPNADAQGSDSKGRDFWLMFDANYTNTGTLTLFITSSINTSGTVSVPGISFSSPFTVAANTVTAVIVPTSVSVHVNDVVDNKGIHVTANDEVTVYGLNQIPFTTDAYLGLPTDVLGTDYILLTYKSGSFGADLGIVGTVDGTTVTITPAATTLSHLAGVPFNITLNQGQTYELENSGDADADLTGTIIHSTQPVGVMGSVRCANIPPGYGYCDHICEMLPPTTTWGKKFGTVPLKSRVNGDTWRFLASEDNTIVTINGVAQPAINRGKFIETNLGGQSIIESDKPILVAQYSNGSTFSGNPGDPFMMLIPPLEQFLAGYTLTTVSGFVTHYINLIAPNAIVGTLTLDGVAVSAAEFTPIGATGFSGAQLTVTPGSHTLLATLPFGAFQYGFNNDDSYGYPGGQSFSPIATATSLVIAPRNASAAINTPQCFTALVKDQFGAPVADVRVDFGIKGPNSGFTGFANTNASGIATFCYTGTAPGTDSIKAALGTLADSATIEWTSIKTCDIKLTVTSVDPSCYGSCNGAIDLTVSGATLPVSYHWSNGAVTEDLKNLKAGKYFVKVTDKNGCTAKLKVILSEPSQLKHSFTISPNPTVPGQATETIFLGYGPQSVTITATAYGGTAPYSYNWGGYGTKSSITVSPTITTTYTCIIKDSKGCTAQVCKVKINVVDARCVTGCGNRKDMILICHKIPGTTRTQTLCVAKCLVPGYLGMGDKLGACNCATPPPASRGTSDDLQASPKYEVVDVIDLAPGEVKAFPNPASNYLDVQWNAVSDQNDVVVNVFNVKGQLMMSLNAGKTTLKRLDISKLANGLYILKVFGAGKTAMSSKFIVQK